MAPTRTSACVRAQARVRGIVQGVGFRPFVYRLAREQGLTGHVLNDEHGVLLEVEGAAASVERFFVRLGDEAPPLATIDSVTRRAVSPTGDRAFRIVASARSGTANALVAADSATCADCLSELADPDDRRFRYPFINCTNCGPRFTIVRDVPYDRPRTTMAGFAMCPDCRREYEDPGDRRFHAQPNACPRCGPRAVALSAAGEEIVVADGDPVAWIAGRLAGGAIVAVKGLGGYHLVCDAGDERAVATLRGRKHREDKPFALMAPDVAAARALLELDAEAEALLVSVARPIVLATRREGAGVAAGSAGSTGSTGSAASGGVAEAVAPGACELGVMLPYTPLHHLLVADFCAARGDGRTALVMTSGNVSDEPIAYRDEDALARLTPIADLFLVHDRPIETRTDDSVARTATVAGRRRSLLVRRSRGYVPAPLSLPVAAARPLLACGAEQKNTFCLARDERAWVGHHIGDLEHFATWEAFTTGIDHFQRLFAVTPEVVAHDLHPGYLSTRYALAREDVELIGVQHHHAHLAACLAEHGVTGPAVAAIFDGTGFGSDGTVWGGELLVGDLSGYERVGSLRAVAMPGGAAAIRQPWRMAAAWLAEALGEPQPRPQWLHGVTEARWRAMAEVGARPAVSPTTSSMGRLLDAVGVLCGVGGGRVQISYEGQAAIELEALARSAGPDPGGRRYEIAPVDGETGIVLDPRGALRALLSDLESGVASARVAARFHAAVAAAAVTAVTDVAGRRGLDTAALSGGVFQNRILLESVSAGLAAAGLRVLVPERLPVNDGGIAFGQAAIAAARTRAAPGPMADPDGRP